MHLGSTQHNLTSTGAGAEKRSVNASHRRPLVGKHKLWPVAPGMSVGSCTQPSNTATTPNAAPVVSPQPQSRYVLLLTSRCSPAPAPAPAPPPAPALALPPPSTMPANADTLRPAATAVMLAIASEVTSMGAANRVRADTAAPSPSCPNEALPHASTRLPASMMQCAAPAATWCTQQSATSDTGAGVAQSSSACLMEAAPRPNCPLLLSPHASTDVLWSPPQSSSSSSQTTANVALSQQASDSTAWARWTVWNPLEACAQWPSPSWSYEQCHYSLDASAATAGAKHRLPGHGCWRHKFG